MRKSARNTLLILLLLIGIPVAVIYRLTTSPAARRFQREETSKAAKADENQANFRKVTQLVDGCSDATADKPCPTEETILSIMGQPESIQQTAGQDCMHGYSGGPGCLSSGEKDYWWQTQYSRSSTGSSYESSGVRVGENGKVAYAFSHETQYMPAVR